ncbi:hypothetical protein ACLB2K_064308 [Fragaria x ananassa]
MENFSKLLRCRATQDRVGSYLGKWGLRRWAKGDKLQASDRRATAARRGRRAKVSSASSFLIRFLELLCKSLLTHPLWVNRAISNYIGFLYGGSVCSSILVSSLPCISSLVLNIKMGACVSKSKTLGDDESEHTVEFTGGNVNLITTIEQWDRKLAEAKTDGKMVIANFSATWCGPCKQIAPLFRELSEQYTSLMFLVVDVDELTDFSTSWDIKATPTFFFLRDGQQVDKLVGANKVELQKKIVAIVDSAPCKK